MEKCPTCNAKYKGKKLCHRCKTDLSILIDIEKKAGDHLEKARLAFMSKDYANMFFHARRSFSLQRTPESQRLLASASLLVKNFSLAVSLALPARLNEK